MRAIFTVTASLLICVGLLGCNRNQQAQAPAPAPVAAAAPVCNCPQQTAAVTPVSIPHRHSRHHHRSWRGYDGSSHSDSYRTQSENSYASDESYSSEYDSGGESEQSPPVPAHAEAAVWVDGYGRSHYAADAQESESGDVAEVTATDVHRRLAPYHGYNSDCDRR